MNAEQKQRMEELIRETFGTPLASADHPEPESGRFVLTLPEPQRIRYFSVREDITEGQRIRGFRILADGRPVYESQCGGHRRIVPFADLTAREIAFEITEETGGARLRDMAVYR